MSTSKADAAYITHLLTTRTDAVERAIVAIYNRQTEDEKNSETTKHHNDIGFSSSDARIGTYYAKWVIQGNNLTGKHLDRARKLALKYVRQLQEISKEKILIAARSYSIAKDGE